MKEAEQWEEVEFSKAGFPEPEKSFSLVQSSVLRKCQVDLCLGLFCFPPWHTEGPNPSWQPSSHACAGTLRHMEILQKVMDVIWHFTWRDSTLTFGRRLLHGSTAHMLLQENSEPFLECDCRGEQLLSWAVACPIGEILVCNSSGHWVLIWIGLLEGLVSSKVLLPETWRCNYWLVKRSKRIKPAFVWPAKTCWMDLLF